MTKITITEKQRKFLIVWVCINCFALLVNVADLKGTIKEGSRSLKEYGTYYLVYPQIHLFTSGMDQDGFWPFTGIISRFDKVKYTKNQSLYNEWKRDYSDEKFVSFYGIFNGYNFLAFFVYTLLGFAIVFLPKYWSTQPQSTNQ